MKELRVEDGEQREYLNGDVLYAEPSRHSDRQWRKATAQVFLSPKDKSFLKENIYQIFHSSPSFYSSLRFSLVFPGFISSSTKSFTPFFFSTEALFIRVDVSSIRFIVNWCDCKSGKRWYLFFSRLHDTL